MQKTSGWVILIFLTSLSLTLTPLYSDQEGVVKVDGKIFNLTTGQIVPNNEVSLRIISKEGAITEQKSSSDSSGSFSFGEIKLLDGATYSISTRYSEVDYEQSLTLNADKPKSDVELKVYELSTDPSIVKIAAYHMILDFEGKQPFVTEYIILQNSSDYSYLSHETTSPSPEGNRVGLKLELPAGYSDLEVEEGLMTCCLTFEENRLLYSHATKPGNLAVALRYKVKAGKEVDLSRQLTFDTSHFLLLLPDSVPKVSSDDLTISEPVQLEGKSYNTYTASQLKSSSLVGIKLQGFKGRDGSIPWVNISLILAVVGGGGLGAVIYQKRKVNYPRLKSRAWKE